MNRMVSICCVVLATAGFAQAKDTKPGSAAAQKGSPTQRAEMDYSKVGPNARKPTDEKMARKDIEGLIAKCDASAKSGDFQAALASIDFPVFMITDDTKGIIEAKQYSRDEYAAMMKPFFETMPKDTKTTHKPTITILSDSLATVVDDYTMTMGTQKVAGKNTSFAVKRDGEWKWKFMAEAGWGGMSQPGTGGSAPTESQKY